MSKKLSDIAAVRFIQAAVKNPIVQAAAIAGIGELVNSAANAHGGPVIVGLAAGFLRLAAHSQHIANQRNDYREMVRAVAPTPFVQGRARGAVVPGFE